VPNFVIQLTRNYKQALAINCAGLREAEAIAGKLLAGVDVGLNPDDVPVIDSEVSSSFRVRELGDNALAEEETAETTEE